MLPSGNDAAYTIANYFGEILLNGKYAKTKETAFPASWEFERTNTKYFLREMNEQAAKLKMYQTNYDSPHGLMNKTNVSTAQDQARVAAEIMKDEYMREIVGTRAFECRAFNTGHKYYWENTNKLLALPESEGFKGVKTGITNAAGPCLASCCEREGQRVIIIVLCSKSMEQRWVEVPKMAAWAIQKLKRDS